MPVGDGQQGFRVARLGEPGGYSPTSSAVLLSVATLKKFGLLEEVGGGASRLVKLTDLALHILLSAEGAEERAEWVREAALCPSIHAELWQQYGDELPSDTNLKRTLILERGFADAAANDLIREYKETISFAGVNAERKMRRDEPRQVPEEAPRMLPPTTFPQAAAIVQPADKPAGLRRYAFPLADSPDAELYLPVPMSEENYSMLKAMVESFLTMSRPALVARQANQQAAAGGGAE